MPSKKRTGRKKRPIVEKDLVIKTKHDDVIKWKNHLNYAFDTIDHFESVFSYTRTQFETLDLNSRQESAVLKLIEGYGCLRKLYRRIQEGHEHRKLVKYEDVYGLKQLVNSCTKIFDEASMEADKKILDEIALMDEADMFIKKVHRSIKRVIHYYILINVLRSKIADKRQLLDLDNKKDLFKTLSERTVKIFICGFPFLAATKFCPEFLKGSNVMRQLANRLTYFDYEIDNIRDLMKLVFHCRKLRIARYRKDLTKHQKILQQIEDAQGRWEVEDFTSDSDSDSIPIENSVISRLFLETNDSKPPVKETIKRAKKVKKQVDFWATKQCKRKFTKPVITDILLGSPDREQTNKMILQINKIEEFAPVEPEMDLAITLSKLPKTICYCETNQSILSNVKKLNYRDKTFDKVETGMYIHRLWDSINIWIEKLAIVLPPNRELFTSIIEEIGHLPPEMISLLADQEQKLDPFTYVDPDTKVGLSADLTYSNKRVEECANEMSSRMMEKYANDGTFCEIQ